MSRRGIVAIALSTLLLAGCFTGKRPYFSDSQTFPSGSTTGDPAIDTVLDKLDHVTGGPVTATYTVLTKYGNTTRPAVVALSPGKRNIEIANTRYIQTETVAATCTTDGSVPCVTGFDPQRISDTGLTVDFYAADTAKRLRRDALAKLAPAVAHDDVIAGQTASCVDVSVPGGTAVYCVLSNGMVAKLDDGDVLVTLTLFGDVADASSFVVPT